MNTLLRNIRVPAKKKRAGGGAEKGQGLTLQTCGPAQHRAGRLQRQQRGRKLGPDAEAFRFYERPLYCVLLCSLQIKKRALEARDLS